MSDGENPIDVVNAPECPRCHSKNVKPELQKPPQRTYWRCQDCGKTGDTPEFIPVLRYRSNMRVREGSDTSLIEVIKEMPFPVDMLRELSPRKR